MDNEKSKIAEAKQFTPEEAENLLHSAGAPKPWARSNLIPNLASMMSTLQALPKNVPVNDRLPRLYHRYHKSVAELRNVLPKIISDRIATSITPSFYQTAEDRSGAIREALTLVDMLAALVDLKPTPAAEKTILNWHAAASMLFLYYTRVVGSGSTSKKGPAARFVQVALETVGKGRHELDVIEYALDNYGPLGLHWNDTLGTRDRGPKKLA